VVLTWVGTRASILSLLTGTVLTAVFIIAPGSTSRDINVCLFIVWWSWLWLGTGVRTSLILNDTLSPSAVKQNMEVSQKVLRACCGEWIQVAHDSQCGH
jgi:hypothetical protein